MANYSFVVGNTYTPFTMQEMLMPYTAYKSEFDKQEAAWDELNKAEDFKYLSEQLPEGSKARQIYEGYAKDLDKYVKDFSRNGLSMSNGTGLLSMKRRYRGEIGRLSKADEALKTEQKLRQSLNAQDSSRLYASDNLSIDDFLDGKNPNLYSISGKEIYARGAATGKAFSSRIVKTGEGNLTLGGYYRDLVAQYGYSPEVLNSFVKDMSAIPELKASYDNYMEASGANANLSTANRQRATKEWVSGVLDGAIYQENHSPQRDLGKPTWAEERADKRAQQQQAISMWQSGAKWDKDGNVVGDEENLNYKTKKLAAEAAQAQFNTMYIEDPNNKGSYILNPNNINNYSLDPNGHWKKNPTGNNGADAETLGEEAAIVAELEKKGGDRFTDNSGFTVNYKTKSGYKNRHYTYVGAISNHDGHWYRGKLGEDDPGRVAGFTASNVVSSWGDYTAQSLKKRLLTQDEVISLLCPKDSEFENLSELGKNITRQILESDSPIVQQAVQNAAKANPTKAKTNTLTLTDLQAVLPIQIFEVPNQVGSRKGYLVAIADK